MPRYSVTSGQIKTDGSAEHGLLRIGRARLHSLALSRSCNRSVGKARMMRILILIMGTLVAMFAMEPPASSELNRLRLPSSRQTPLDQSKCPRTLLQIEKLVKGDAGDFKRRYPSGTWATFVHVFNRRYANCPSFVKRMYLEAARDILEPPQRNRWGR